VTFRDYSALFTFYYFINFLYQNIYSPKNKLKIIFFTRAICIVDYDADADEGVEQTKLVIDRETGSKREKSF
jgi:hypothetical protein